MQRILVPVDFSPYSINAFKTALSLAEKTNSQITLLHVIHLPFHFFDKPHKNNFDEARQKAYKKLEKLVHQVSSGNGAFSGIKINIYVLSGLASPSILQTIRKIDSDFLIMGRKGETEIKKLAVGSVAKDVVLHSKIPVMMVSESINYANLNHLLFTTAFDARNLKSLNWAVDLASVFNANVTALHISENGENGYDQKNKNEFLTLLKENKKFKNLQLDSIKNDNTFDGIFNYIQQQPPSMIALARYKKSSFSTLNYKKQVQKLLEDSQIPVVVFAGN
ncbi:MAG: universal stress protein [Balneolaceae bacterium]